MNKEQRYGNITLTKNQYEETLNTTNEKDELIYELKDRIRILENVRDAYEKEEKKMKHIIRNFQASVKVLNNLRDLDKEIIESKETSIGHLENIIELKEDTINSKNHTIIGMSIYSTFITIMLILAVIVA